MDYAIPVGVVIVLLTIIAFLLGRKSTSNTDERLDILETRVDNYEQEIKVTLRDMYGMDKLIQESLRSMMSSHEAQWATLLRDLDAKALPAAGYEDKEDSA